MIIHKVIKVARNMGFDVEELMQKPLIDVLTEMEERKDTFSKWEKELEDDRA